MIHSEVALITPVAKRFAERRERLRNAVGSGLIVIPGHDQPWRNADNPYPFRQSSHLLYLAPVRRPGVTLVLDADAGEDILYGTESGPDDVVWHGPQPGLADEAAAAGLSEVRDVDALPDVIRAARDGGRSVHTTPPYVASVRLRLAEAFAVSPGDLDQHVSETLIRALGELRLRKSPDEIAEIEQALAATAAMFSVAMREARPGATEAGVRAAMAREAFARGLDFSFDPIVTVRGEVLHNHAYVNTLEEGDLLLIDAGLETPAGYASDITRTMPVGGRFSNQQREIYEIVLAAQEAAITAMRPGAGFRDIHVLASRTIATGLIELGLMRGDPAEAVAEGAHALFFAHGLGHPLGLDVHDLHDLGDVVAYPEGVSRSTQFGTRFLRFARDLDANMVMTVEPGIYFIPPLIDEWKGEGKHAEFIDYDRLEGYRDFGGIRVEDDVLITEAGARILGPTIPRSVDDVSRALR